MTTNEICKRFPYSTPGQANLANYCTECDHHDCPHKSDRILINTFNMTPLDKLFNEYQTPIIRSFKDDIHWIHQQ